MRSAASTSAIWRVFTLEVSPDAIRTLDLGQPKTFAIRRIKVALAAPSLGAVVTLALR